MLRRIACSLLLIAAASNSIALTRLIYTDNRLSAQSYRSQPLINAIRKHHQAIDVLAPQAYTLNEDGTVWGSVAPRVMALGKKHHFQLMPLVMNDHFDRDKLHRFLHSPEAQQHAITQLLAACQHNHYWGMQFDIENLPVIDRTLYSQFVQQAATAFHQHQLKLSVTVLPNQIPPILTDSYSAWFYDNWSGGYDIKALAKTCDFVTLMAYDRHNTLTTPGPIAPLPWVRLVLKQALRVTYANKILLGVPLYSGYWSTTPHNKSFASREHQISYAEAMDVLQQYQAKTVWDTNSGCAVATLNGPNKLYSYLYVQNARSLQIALNLAKENQLQGIAAWQLGLEDPAVWPLLQKAQ